MNRRVKNFTLKEKDFQSGKMVSPPRDRWKKCDCCGLQIVQGVVMQNGDHIGNDCFKKILNRHTFLLTPW